MKAVNNKLGQLLRELRLEKKMSLREFSGCLGISHAYLDKLEKGVDLRTGKGISPTIEILLKIADSANIPSRKFFEMCGYFEDTSFSLGEPQYNARLDIAESLDDLKVALSTTQAIVYNERALTSEETAEVISRLDELSQHLMTKS